MANTRCKPKGEPPLCECGCGQPTNWQASHNRWAKFIDGHQNLGRASAKRIEKGEPPLCACGCGLPVRTYRYGPGWVRYLNNHAPRQPHTPEALEKMRQAALRRNLNGPNNPAWKDGKSADRAHQHPGRIQQSHWRRIKEVVLERDGHQCVVCGAKRRLDTHHVDGNVLHDSFDNLVTLCHKHHIQAEVGKEALKIRELIMAYMSTLIEQA